MRGLPDEGRVRDLPPDPDRLHGVGLRLTPATGDRRGLRAQRVSFADVLTAPPPQATPTSRWENVFFPSLSAPAGSIISPGGAQSRLRITPCRLAIRLLSGRRYLYVSSGNRIRASEE
jgi:hypothetical protein